MPIISKETWDLIPQEEKDKLREYLNDNDENIHANYIMDDLFGKENFLPQLTYEDVARELFFEKKGFYIASDSRIDEMIFDQQYKVWLQTNNCTSRKQAEKLLAINKLLNVAVYLNKNEDGTPWKPDWENIEEEKWFFYFDKDGNFKPSFERSFCNRIAYFRNRELTIQAYRILGEDVMRLALTNEY